MNTVDDKERSLRLEEENRRLRGAVEELTILNEIATVMSSTLSLDRIVEVIVQKCVKHLNVEQVAVVLLHESDERKPFHTMIRSANSGRDILPYRLDDQITGWMLKNQKPLLINDFEKDDRFNIVDKQRFPIRSMLSVPLRLKGRMIGLLNVFNKRMEGDFSADDQRLLSIIASQSAQAIENARLYEEEQALVRMQEEMRLAYEIQMKLMPKEPPQVPGYEIAGKSIPAMEVGGDYFDFIPVDKHQLAFCLGDISGKGMPAALLMANLQATLRGQIFLNTNARECVQRSNTLLYRSTDTNKFATLFYGLLNTQNHELCYCNAGHNPPILLTRSMQLQRLGPGGLMLGFMEDFSYSQDVVSLAPGDLLILFSDGITEAMNADEEEFEEERLLKVVRENMDDLPGVLIDKIIGAVQSFGGDEPQTDDMTVIVIKRI